MFRDAPLSYSSHAQARIVDRAIFKKQIRRTLRRPDKHYVQGQNQVAEYTTSGGAVIRLVYRVATEGSENTAHIVSAIRLGRLGKLKGASQKGPIETLHDQALDVAYVGLLSGRIAETIEAGSGVYYDLDGFGEIVGVEIFDYSRYQVGEGDSRSVFERLPIPSR